MEFNQFTGPNTVTSTRTELQSPSIHIFPAMYVCIYQQTDWQTINILSPDDMVQGEYREHVEQREWERYICVPPCLKLFPTNLPQNLIVYNGQPECVLPRGCNGIPYPIPIHRTIIILSLQ